MEAWKNERLKLRLTSPSRKNIIGIFSLSCLRLASYSPFSESLKKLAYFSFHTNHSQTHPTLPHSSRFKRCSSVSLSPSLSSVSFYFPFLFWLVIRWCFWPYFMNFMNFRFIGVVFFHITLTIHTQVIMGRF